MNSFCHSINRRAARALGLAVMLLGLVAAPAGADPVFDVQLIRDETLVPIVSRSDERVDYKVEVTNTASENPSVGDELFCNGIETTPGSPKNWNPSDPGETTFPSFTFEWRRNGALIPGETSQTYELTTDDEGAVVQCLVKGANESAAAIYASQPGASVEPQAAIAPPSPINRSIGSSRPVVTPGFGIALRTCTPPTGWTTTATASATSGSNQLTAVATARGTGTTVDGSTDVTALTGTAGTFRVGQAVTIAGSTVVAGTTIVAISDDVLTLSNPVTAGGGSGKVITAGSQPFSVGETIVGNGIPGGTTITAVADQTITLSAAATTTDASVNVSSNATGTWAYQWLRNGQAIAGAMSSTYTPDLTAVGTATRIGGSPSLTAVNMTAGSFAPGDMIAGEGIQPNTEVIAVSAGTVEISKVAESSGSNGSITKGPDSGKQLQCQVTGANAGGSLVGISNHNRINTPANNPNLGAAETPATESSNSTSGPVIVEIELPPGTGTRVDKFYRSDDPPKSSESTPSGWSCEALPSSSAQPGKALCERSDPLSPGGGSYPPFSFTVAIDASTPDVAVTKATVSGGGASVPSSVTDEFAIAPARPFEVIDLKTLVGDSLGAPYRQAGGHPFSAGAAFSLPRKMPLRPGSEIVPYEAIEAPKTVLVDTPRGFVGNALALPELCPTTEALIEDACPLASAVGGIDLNFVGLSAEEVPIYAMEPEFGRPAQFAFTNGATEGVYVIFPRLRPEDGYAITLESAAAPASYPRLLDADAELCGFGAKIQVAEVRFFKGCKEASDPTANPKPLITNPTRCDGPPPTTKVSVDSWNNPGVFKSRTYSDPSVTGCELVKFEPEMSLEPTSSQADSPTGMDVELFMPTKGLEGKGEIAQANLKRISVTLPEGMAVNASAGHGLTACRASQVGINSVTGVPNNDDAQCPDSSKIGTIGITTPLIADKLTGDVFVAKQGADNPFDSNIALYMVFSSPKNGITIKVAGEVKPDPVTGRMTIVFDDNPEAPFSSVELHFPQGPRSPLLNPPDCGTHRIEAELTPWTGGAPVIATSIFQVTEGPNGGPCPAGGFDPKLNAGTTNPVAGETSPFLVRLTRDDGTQRFTGLELSPPQGLTAYLKGIPYCSDATLAAISPAAETGQAQIDNPSCAAASQVGTASAGAGAGSDPFYVNTGKVYLAGPYKGAPISMAVVTPAVAGPLDLGNVVIRTALYVNSKTAQITAVSDPVPTILHGILLDIRDIRVAIDRPNFTLNPTNCGEMSVGAKVAGDKGATASLSNRFQVGDCAALGFRPRLSLSLKGGTKRGDNPALKAVVRPRPGDANIGAAAVTLPRSAFLDQAHIRTVCTRVQFAADNCPKGAIYGRAEAVTPLLDQPLKGPVYLRSSNNKLPDLVADLRGPASQPIKVEAAFRTDSIKGGIRSTLDFAPDAPVTKFTLQMQGGKKGLVINSQDICAKTNRATARMVGQNGRRYDFRPKVVATNCAKKRNKNKR